MRSAWLAIVFSLGACVGAPEAQSGESSRSGGHSHSDYLRRRPLLDALEHGMVSVEADVFLVDGELRVGHERNALRPGRGRPLEALYLDPLQARFRERGDNVRAWRCTADAAD